MEAMLRDLLAYASIESLRQERQHINTTAIIEETADLVLPAKKFNLKIPDNLPSFFVAPAIADLVFRNILSNVAKHHDKGHGVISIGFSITNNTVSITITDDGPGIPEADQQNIFNLFNTIKARNDFSGAGMGLALVKKAMETAGGVISVQSGPERGTTFCLQWPRLSAASGSVAL